MILIPGPSGLILAHVHDLRPDAFNHPPRRFHNMGLRRPRLELKASRAYIAGVGTTGVLIGSFVLLLTVGSALVAFQGVPGQASNADLSSIELQQQAQREAQAAGGLLVASYVLGLPDGAAVGGAGGVLGTSATGGTAG